LTPAEDPAPAAKARTAVEEKRKPSVTQLPAGRVGRAHGLDGSFYVTRGRPRLLTLGTEVTIAGRTAKIRRRAGTKERPIVRIDGIDDRASAQALRGAALMVAVSDAPRLGHQEWWAHELEGCAVFDGERRIGTVNRMIELPSCEALEVRVQPPHHPSSSQPSRARNLPPTDSLLVPMVKDAIRTIDVAAGVIDVNMQFIEE
jgi:16S rRNA processing protein RimM